MPSDAMTSPATLPDGLRARMSFVKLIVHDLDLAQAFYARVLGLVVLQTFESPEMEERVLGRSADDRGPTLVLYRHKDGRPLAPGDLHGPVGFVVSDVDAFYAHAVAGGAAAIRPPFTFGASRVAFIGDPDGHEIELVRFTP